MKAVSIFYRCEDGAWWAESPELVGWSAAGESFEEVRSQAIDGAKLFAGEPIAISEIVPKRATH